MKNRNSGAKCCSLKQRAEGGTRSLEDNHLANRGVSLLAIEINAAGNRNAALVSAIPNKLIGFGRESLGGNERRDTLANDVVDGDWQR
jgi:hypothetical protein